MGANNRLVLYTIICFCGLHLTSCNNTEKQSFVFPVDVLQEGDIVFRCGTSMASNAVLTADKVGEYSHIGIIVKYNDSLMIIHAVPGEPDFEGDEDRVKIDTPEKFFSRKLSIGGAVMRIDNETLVQNAAKSAINIFERETLFDHDYDLTDTTKMYCTELIYFLFNQQGLDLTEGRRSVVRVPALNGSYIFPSDIQQNSILQLIYSY